MTSDGDFDGDRFEDDEDLPEFLADPAEAAAREDARQDEAEELERLAGHADRLGGKLYGLGRLLRGCELSASNALVAGVLVDLERLTRAIEDLG